jgi:hypothetical protein
LKPAELAKRAEEIDAKLSSIKEDATVDFVSVYVEVIALAKRNEKIYLICTYVSWVLYVAGWIVGVGDVQSSLKRYQALFAQPITLPEFPT